jgi:hypothetical protein
MVPGQIPGDGKIAGEVDMPEPLATTPASFYKGAV